MERVKGGWVFTLEDGGYEGEAGGLGQLQSLLKGAWIGPLKLPKRPRTKSEGSKAKGKPKARFAGVQPSRAARGAREVGLSLSRAPEFA